VHFPSIWFLRIMSTMGFCHNPVLLRVGVFPGVTASKARQKTADGDRRMRPKTLFFSLVTTIPALMLASVVHAQAKLNVVGQPKDGAIGFQPPATSLARDMQWLDQMIFYIIAGIVALVVVLLIIVAVRFNKRAHPVPAKFTHNSPLEVAWTLGPVLILVFIGAFSLPVLFEEQEFPKGDIHIKVTGNQWFWSYQYQDNGFGFDSFLLDKNKLVANGYTPDEYLLATDAPVVVPIGEKVVMEVTSADVIHSWTIPAFSVKQDAVPGRLAKLWFKADRKGIYFGQCSQLCGKGHAYMPIEVKVVSQKDYAAWLVKAKKEYAGAPISTLKVASN